MTRHPHRRHRRRPGRGQSCSCAASKPVVLAVNKVRPRWRPPTRTLYEFYNLGLGDPIAVSCRPRPRHRRPAGRLLRVLPRRGGGSGGGGRHQGGGHRQAQRGQVLPGQPVSWGRSGSSSANVAGTTRDAVDSYFENEYGKYRLHRHRRHAQKVQGGRRDRAVLRPPGHHGHGARRRVPHPHRRQRGRHRAGHQGGGSGPRGRARPASSWSTSGTPWKRTTRPWTRCARSVRNGLRLHDLRPHSVYLRPHRPAGGQAL